MFLYHNKFGSFQTEVKKEARFRQRKILLDEYSELYMHMNYMFRNFAWPPVGNNKHRNNLLLSRADNL